MRLGDNERVCALGPDSFEEDSMGDSEVKVEQLSSDLECADETIGAIIVTTALASGVATKVMPERFKKELQKKKTWVNNKTVSLKKKFPRVVWTTSLLSGVVSLALYFLDVFTDVQLCINFYQYKHYGWFTLMVGFIALPYLVAMAGVIFYFHNKHSEKFLVSILFSPILPLGCDVFMPFYRIMQRCTPDAFTNFMSQYEATRLLSETLLETVPQMGLQVYIFFFCDGNEENCDGIEQEAGDALVQSLIIGGICIVYRLVLVNYEMKDQGLNLKDYVKSLIQLGVGLPLRAITENTVKDLKLPTADLLGSQIRSLATAIKSNASILTINDENPFEWAASDKGQLRILQSICENQHFRMYVNNEVSDGKTCLWLSSKKRRVEAIELLLTVKSIDVNKGDSNCQTPLFVASKKGYRDVVEVLLKADDIDVNCANSKGQTPLTQASQSGFEDIVQAMLESPGIHVNQRNQEGQTSLWLASSRGHEEIVRALLNCSDVDVNAADDDGQTPLFVASRKGYRKVVELLLSDDNVDVNCANLKGQTPLIQASQNGDEIIVDVLLKSRGVNMNQTNQKGETSLYVASSRRHLGTIKTLLNYPDVDVNAANNDGQTPLFVASREGFHDVVEILLNTKKVDASGANINGHTALSIAELKRQAKVVRLLNLDKLMRDTTVQMEDGADAVSLDRENVGDLGAKRLAKLLPKYPDVRKLVLSYSQIGDAGALALLEALPLTTIKELDLGGNIFRDKGHKTRFSNLQNSEGESIIVNFTNTDEISEQTKQELDDAVSEVRDGASKLSGLRSIGNAGVSALLEMLSPCPNLKKIDLERNDIGDIGARKLAEALPKFQELSTLDLRFNLIGSAGANSLAMALPNSQLTKLVLVRNPIPNDVKTKLANETFTNRHGQNVTIRL